MALSFKQIEVFRAVITTGSISAAAKLLFVSQPAVSRLLSYTEQRLGFALFERAKGRLYATPEAHELFREIERVYAGIQRVNEVAAGLASRPSGQIHIVSGASIGQTLVPQAIALFLTQFPEVKVTFRRMTNAELVKTVLAGEAEFGLQIGSEDHPNLAYTPLARAPMVCICPNGHPLAERGPLTVNDLLAYPLVSYPSHMPLGQLIAKMYAEAQQTRIIAVDVASPQHACSMVEAGVGIALVDSFSAYSRDRSKYTICELLSPPVSIARLVHPQNEPLSRLATAFTGTVREVIAGYGDLFKI